MKDDGVDEQFCAAKKAEFLAMMQAEDQHMAPEIVYAFVEAMVEHYGHDVAMMCREAIGEIDVAAGGGITPTH